MSTGDDQAPDLDDVMVPEEVARPDRHEHAKTPHPIDEDRLAERTEHERQQAEADGRRSGEG